MGITDELSEFYSKMIILDREDFRRNLRDTLLQFDFLLWRNIL